MLRRLRPLAVVVVDRDRLGVELPGLHVGLLDFVGRRLVRHVDRLRDRTRDEGLRRAHHLQMPAVVDEARALRRLERAVEDRQVAVLQVLGLLDRVVRVDVLDDASDLLRVVAEAPERRRHRLVDDLHMVPLPTRCLYLRSSMSGSTPVVSQSSMSPIVPVGASTVARAVR